MIIKKFDKFNESVQYSENEQKAIDAGYQVGDMVFSKTMGKVVTIVQSVDDIINRKDDSEAVKTKKAKDDLVTLGAVGENLKYYTKTSFKRLPTSDKVDLYDIELDKWYDLLEDVTNVENVQKVKDMIFSKLSSNKIK